MLHVRLIVAMTVALALLMMTACADSSSASGEVDTQQAGGVEPGPPADYVRSKCSECSCRVYMGEQGSCTRPACRHGWKNHQRPPQGS